ncbi:hypothetical protein BGX24_009910 [Mortierella sp. AD032]|nr:hypothetical protein BGX24_009910 [Mortierella sp. AD032]
MKIKKTPAKKLAQPVVTKQTENRGAFTLEVLSILETSAFNKECVPGPDFESPPAVKTLIQALTECPESEIPKLIEEVPEWNWPRGDIFLWVAVLNRFDDILDTLCKTHDMKKPQPKPFSETDQRLTLAILYFSRLLLENCTNRNLYASYEQLNDLLHSSDLDILESCLRLLLRPAQRHSSQRNTKSIFTVSQDRLLALTHSWGTREHGLEMIQLMDEGAQIPEKLSGLHFQFFRTATYNKPTTATITPAGAAAPASSSSAASGSATTSTQGPTTISATSLSSPSKQRRSSQSGSTSTPATTSCIPGSATEGLVVIQAADINNMGASDHEILSHYVKEYSIPEEHQFSLLSRIRVATAMRNPQRRRKLLMIRILGIAVMSHVLPETVVIDKFFAFEPEIIQSLADLIHPDHKVPFDLQTAALFALDGLAHLRNKQADVYTAVNASASHGILLYMLRKTVSGLDSDTVIYPQEFVDAIVAFIGYIISGQTGGNMVIAAGLVPVLLKLLANKRASQVKNVTKSIHLLDSLIYGYSSAFTSFCTSDGLNILVARIKDETEYALGIVKDFDTSQSPDKSSSASKDNETSPVPFERTALLKSMFKFVHHMMQSPGTQEGLRNLIETTLPSTLKKIMESPAALGAAIYAHAINTMASFIHNEPTSLAILQEANIPQTLLASLSKEIPISPEVVMSVPGAFGAICLNSAGLTMFKEKFDLKKLFDIFTSIPHVRAFQDNDGASNLGLSVDELVRHQPSLKPTVLSAVITMLDQVFKMCQDITFADDLALSTLQKERSKSVPALGEVTEESAAKVPKKDGVVPPLIEAAAKFCESYFQNAAIAKDFLKSGGIDCLMKFYSLHTLPYDLANTSAFFTLSHLIKLLAETTPSTSIIAVVEEVQKQLDVIEPLLESVNPESNLLKFIDISNSTEEDIALGNRYLHALVSLNALSGLLSDMYLTPAFSHGRNQASVLAAFVAAKGDKALNGLGKLHRMCIWETIALKRSLQQDWNDPNPKAKRSSNVALIPGTVEEHFEEPAVEAKELTEKAAPKMDMFSPIAINTKYFKFVLTQTPHYITPLYQGITKMLFHRRDVDSAQRAGAFKIADSLSRVLQSHISWKRSADAAVADRFTYFTAMLPLLPLLMLDDRSPPTLQTIVVVSFVRVEGLQTLFATLDSIWSAVASEPTAPEAQKMYGAIELILSVLQTIVSSKLLHDSSHTSLLLPKDDKNKKGDLFEPHEFLVVTRLAVLPKAKKLWMDPNVRSCPAGVVRLLINILIIILRGEGESKPEAPPLPSVMMGGGVTPHLFGARPMGPDPRRVATLVDMGFPRSAAEIALTRCGNQTAQAAEYLLTHQDIVAAAMYDQARDATSRTAPTAPASTESTTTVPSTGGQPGSSAGESTSAQTSANPAAEANTGEDDEESMLQRALEMSVDSGAASTSADVSMSEPAGSSSPKSLDQTLTPEAHKNRQEQLEDIRQGVRNTLVDRSLELLPLIDGIIFSIRDIFVFLSKEKDNTVLEGLVDVTVTTGQKHDAADSEHSQETGELFGTHLRLLALLFAEANIQAAMETHARKLLPQLMSTLSKASSSTGSQKKESNWLSPLLLMVEGFVSLSDELKSVPDEAAGDGKSKTTQEDQAMTEQLVAESDLGTLLKHCISLLKQEDLSKDVVISVFRILVRLTRHHSLAVEFLEAQGLSLMFSTLKTESIGVQGQQSYIIMVMRHIIEDTVVLQATMEREIVRWFSQPSRPRVGDMVSYLRHNSFLGLRDLEAFISGTLKVCSVAKYDQAHRAVQLTLTKLMDPPKNDDIVDKAKGDTDSAVTPATGVKDNDADKDKEKVQELKVDETAASSSAAPLTAAVAEVTKKYSSEVSEAVMYFLVNELLNCRTTAIPEQPATSTGAAAETIIAVSGSAPETAGNSSKNSTSTTPEVALDPAFVHRCFLLQCLNELVASYPCCKVDLMNYSRKKRDPLNTASKPRTNWLGYLLNDLVPYRGTASQLSNTEIRKQSIESNFASSVLVAMCLNSDEDEEKKPFSEAVQVRRFIVDGITRAFKDAMSSTEPIELKYGKFLALSELSFKLLGSSSPGVPLKPNNDVSMNVVKVMLEKNFITTLTNVVADIDLNYPHAKVMVTALLRPLESLTRLSLKMSRASDSSAPKPRRRSTPLSAGGSGAGSGDDAPDLYRNSSLGMFDGTNIESEEDGETGDSSGDEEMFEGEEFDEDDASDASDLSEEDMSDEDEDEDDGEEDAIRNPFHDDEDDHDGSDDEDHDEDDDMDDDNEDDIDAEIQEAIDRDEEEDEDLVMEWGTDRHHPVMLGEDEIDEVIEDDDDIEDHDHADHDHFDDDDDLAHPHHHQHHHHHHSGDEGTEEDEGDEDDEDASDDDEDDLEDDDDMADHEGIEEDEFEAHRHQGRNAPWDMTSTFVINEPQLRPLFEPAGRRGRLSAQDRAFLWDEPGVDSGRFSYLHDHALAALAGGSRNSHAQGTDDVTTHPLLAQPASATAAGNPDNHRPRGAGPRVISDWQSFEELLQGNAQQVIGSLLNGGAIRAGHGGAFRVEVNNDHSTTLIPIERPGGHHHHHHHHHHGHQHSFHGPNGDTITATISIGGNPTDVVAAGQKSDMFAVVNDFVPFTTPQRWSQECRMMYGATVQTKASRIQNHLINALIPLAKREAQLRQERDAKEQEQRRKADAERKKAAEEKRKADEEAQRIKKEEQEKARAAEEQAEAKREAARQAEVAAARLARGETGEPESLSGAEGSSSTSATAEPAATVTPARKLVTIDGELVDITDSDIDAEFLEALPEDMRREVYNDYLQSRPPPTATTSSAVTNANTSSNVNNSNSSNASHNINSEFLNALPQGMREELDELIRGPRPAANEPARPVALQADPTRLLSQLIPDLRQAMGEDLAATLPQNFLDSTQAFLSNLPRLRGHRDPRSILGGDLARPGASAPTTAKKSTVPREAIQLVDKSSLATLIRLMFLPQPLPRNILNKLLVNLCENSKTRAELLSLLLSILQDGGADLAAVDRSFAQMSLRGKPLFKANQQTKGSKGSAASAPAPVSMDNVPNLVARRCFEALYYIVSYNEQASLFFLSEHETVTLKRSGKKGKGKEKAIESKYPIVLLLDLLERPIFVQNSALMEQLMTLLSIICRPLSTLAKPKENSDKETTVEEDKEKKEVETAGTDAAGDGTSSTNAAAVTVTESSDSAKTEEATGSDAKPETKTTDEQSDFQPPVIPDHCLQLVVSVLTAGECSSRTFQFTLSVIQNLSLLTGARDIITTELVNAARDLGADIRTDLDTLSQTLENAMSGVDVQGMVLDKFSPASSKQAKLLRALKTIDYMYSRKQAPANAPVAQVNIELAPTVDPEEADSVLPRSMRDINSELLNLNKDEERATEIYDGLSFHELWTKVGSTLEQIHERSDMIHVATVLLPLIESFMVVCKYVGLRPSTLEVEEEVCRANTNSTEELFLQFTEKHSKILNIMVRNNPALMSGSFSLLVHNPKMLEFDNKRNYFTQQMHKRNTARDLYGSLQMNVRREWVFMDSYSHWQARTGDEIKYSKLNVKFHGEEGVDGGGVTREWFQVLARQMFNPDYAMFKTSAADKLTYQPNRASWVNPDHLLFFKFVGRVIGKAIYDGRLLDAYFTRSFYKHILGRPVDYRDVEAIDPEYYKSLVWMLENDITDIVDETFSVETDDFGNKKTVDLKPNGRNIAVTEENKHEYVKYITEQKLTLAIKDQIHSFLLGFHEIIPAHLISIFNEQELELLISGLPDIDIDEWKNNAEYQNYTQSSPQILNFWRAVRSFDQTERAKLLQFVTGTSKVPLGGFAQLQGISGIQKFQIHKDFSSTKRLPSAHTCFNQLDLPEYETYEELRQQLLTAISECSTGFAFA